MTWRSALRAALILNMFVCVAVHAYVQEPIPPLIILFVLFGVALWLLRREGRAGVWLGGIASLLLLLGNLPFLAEDLSHPESALAFITSFAGVVGAIGGFIAMIAVLLGWGTAGASTLILAGGALVVIGLVVGVVAALGVENDDRQEGDVEVLAEDVEFEPEDITVDAGGAVFIDNKDPYRHTFSVDDLGVDKELPASANKRVVIDAEPGEYEYHCDVTGHDDMEGTLTVR